MAPRFSLPALILTLALAPTFGAATATPTAPPRPAATTTAPATKEPADQPKARAAPTSAWMRQHNTYVDNAKKGNVDLYMLGDSITDFWANRPAFKPNWDKNLGGWKPGEFGISGDRTQHVLWRIQNGELDGVTPKAIVLLIGTNNLPPNPTMIPNTPEEVAKGIKAILTTLQEKQPQAKILLLAIFPRADARAGADIMDKVNATNKILATFDDGKNVKFLDINPTFLTPEGKLTADIMPDFLHPSEKGYQQWADAIRPTLTQWLGAPAATQPAK